MSQATEGLRRVEIEPVALREPVIVVSPTPPRSTPRPWISTRTALAALVVLGFGLRLVPMIQNRDLWIDEAMLALNLVERSAAGLLEPLAWNQGAPAGFLLTTKAAITAFGPTEWAFRFVPFVGSLFGLIAFAWVAGRLLPAPAAILAVGLAAVNPFLITYAAECKQYATDASLAVGLFAVAFGLLHGEGGFRRWSLLAMCGAMAVWFSHPAAFVLGGIGTALFLDAAVNRDRRRCLACVAVIACWLASFAVCYVTTIRQLGDNSYLLHYWAGHFFPLPPTGPGDVAWMADHFLGFFVYPGGLGGADGIVGGLAAALFLVGLRCVWRDRWPVAVAIALPAMFALFASGLEKYPFAGRLLLFLVPFMLLVVARGAWAITEALRPTQPFAVLIILGLLVLTPLVETYQQARRPQRHEQITELLAELQQRVQPGDRVYLYYGAKPAFLFYTRESPFPVEVTLGNEHRKQRTGYRDELRQFAGEPRVWIVFSHRHNAEESLLLAYAEGLGERQEEFRRPGASAFRFDFRRPD